VVSVGTAPRGSGLQLDGEGALLSPGRTSRNADAWRVRVTSSILAWVSLVKELYGARTHTHTHTHGVIPVAVLLLMLMLPFCWKVESSTLMKAAHFRGRER
jgi:hypothetical protein